MTQLDLDRIERKLDRIIEMLGGQEDQPSEQPPRRDSERRQEALARKAHYQKLKELRQ